MNDPHGTFELADLMRVDADVGRVVRSLRAARLAKDADTDPFGSARYVAGKSTFDALASRPWTLMEAPHAAALKRWVYALTLERLANEKEIDRAKAEDDEKAPVTGPEPKEVSLRDAMRAVVHSDKRNEVQSYLRTAGEIAPRLAPFETEPRAIRKEAAHRLGVDDTALFETGVASSALTAFATSFLARTESLATDLLRSARKRAEIALASPMAADWFVLAVGRDAREGWPAHLTRRWLEDFAPTLVRGLQMNIGTLPDALGTSSFARALQMYGRALRDAGPSPSLPFAIRQDPFAADAARFGMAFASLVAVPSFHRLILGNVQRTSAQQARVGATTLLFAARLEAVRWLRTHGTDPDELGHRLLDAQPPGELFFGWPSARSFRTGEPPRGAAEMVALATAGPFVQSLVDRHDDDWFRNPRALNELRARASAPAFLPEEAFDAEARATALSLDFERSLA